ncbi:fbox domain containing protein [Stylonychia lemnae]|uniref:Fbox domain containing protein n=1 Tax=Stylonychia lemnae TaxID=5949 RepID=A0A078AIV9_STYLE|nr:fbox domain containing protein [Stylonychia lemnae]|eukprot:CDW82159.1 fbox domain containing protein [Stylonychia lemnae]
MGMEGEGRIDDSVWIIKTHYPERIGHTEFNAHKCIVIIRSPIDCIASLFNMIATGSHNQSITDEQFEKVRHIWNDFVNDEVKVWADFHYYWTKSPQSIPTHFVRYEDLLLKPYETLVELFKFLLNKENLDGLKIHQIIQQVTIDQERPEVYKPRSGKINASKKFFTKEQLVKLRQVAYREIRRFGYLKMNQYQENPTGFISEDEEEEKTQIDKEHSNHVAWLLDFNMKMLSVALKMNEQFKDDLLNKVYIRINKKEEIVRKQSKEDPTARGARKYKSILRDLLI